MADDEEMLEIYLSGSGAGAGRVRRSGMTADSGLGAVKVARGGRTVTDMGGDGERRKGWENAGEVEV